MKSLLLFLAMFILLTDQGCASNPKIEIFDASAMLKINEHDTDQRRMSWDQQQLLAAIQGIVNRQQPRLYVLAVGPKGGIDRYWLSKLRAPGQWLTDQHFHKQGNLKKLINDYRGVIRGLVVWDERVPATALVASTAAGAEDLLPVRYDPAPHSLYTALTTGPQATRIPIRLRLINADGSPMFTGRRTGSAKCDATLWAVEHFLKTGKCNPLHLAYYPDAYWLNHPGRTTPVNTLLLNHDYFISQRAFFFDLDPWNDEAPYDDPKQKVGTDFKTLQTLLRIAHERAKGTPICIGGFEPWNQKYTRYTGARHGDVETEWRYCDIISCFDAYMDADAPAISAMANASVFCHYPLAPKYPQRNVVSSGALRGDGFLDAKGRVKPANYATIYVGDYDSAAWLYQRMPSLWDDPNRGRIPLGWAFDPSLEQRFPVGLAYARATATPNDSFIAGDCGYGYLNPGDLVPPRRWSGLPSGLPGWQNLCEQAYRRWDLHITGFIINGFAPRMEVGVENAYAHFSPDGIISQSVPRLSYVHGVPLVQMGPDLLNPGPGAIQIAKYFPSAQPQGPCFGVFRTILWSPTKHLRMFQLLARERPDIKIVSPQIFMRLAALADRG